MLMITFSPISTRPSIVAEPICGSSVTLPALPSLALAQASSAQAWPTHPVRLDQTKHSAHVEFAAKEYTPNRDFEVVAELPTRFSPHIWHAHEMAFGFGGAVVAGFLLTAIPNWTGRMPLQGAPLAGLVLLWMRRGPGFVNAIV